MADNIQKEALEELDSKLNEAYEKSVKTQRLVEENKEIQAQIYNVKLKMQKSEIDKISNIHDNLQKEDLTKRGFDKQKMLRDLDDRKNAVIFLNEKISKHFIAAPGSLIVIPSMTNNGKSTLTAHIAEAMVNKDKKVLILSNEEKEEDVRARISCLRTRVSFGDYKTNKCSVEEIEKVLDDAELLANSSNLVVISPKNESDAYKVTTVKGVMATLEKAKGVFDAVIIDYYTNVNISEMGAQDPWTVNNALASELNVFKDSSPFPIIAMAQCDSLRNEKNKQELDDADFEAQHPMYRWKGGKSIIIYATDIIELKKDFENSRSYLYAHKVRFGHGDLLRGHVLYFDKKMQRFSEWTPQIDAQVTASKAVRQTKDQSRDIGLSDVFKDKNERNN
jgi:replicative DNA helicase